MNFQKWFIRIEQAIRDAEIKFGRGKGIDKRKFAIELINAIVDIPILPEFLEEKIIGLLVDFAVDIFNRKFGKRWIDVMPAGQVQFIDSKGKVQTDSYNGA